MMSKKISAKRSRQKGVTLIELLVSMTVFLLGTAAIYGVLRLATVEKNTVNARTDQMRSARISLEYLRRDALNAGYRFHRTGGNVPDNVGNGMFGIASDSDLQRDLMTAVIAGNEINTNNLKFGGRTDVVGFIKLDTSFNEGNLITYTSAVANGSSVDVSTDANACLKCEKHDLYMFESASGTTQLLGMVTSRIDNSKFRLAVGDPFNLNQAANETGDKQSLLTATAGGGTFKRVSIISYSVTPDGVLVRKRFGNEKDKAANEQVETRELVYGVSEFQIKYYMEDGTTVDDPSLGNNGRNNQMKMNNVVQIQISITLMPTANDGQPMMATPVTLMEFISTKNLRYEATVN